MARRPTTTRWLLAQLAAVLVIAGVVGGLVLVAMVWAVVYGLI